MTDPKEMKLNKVDDKTSYENLLVKYAELIKENEEMKKGLGCETCQIHLEYMRLNDKIRELENENAELKAELKDANEKVVHLACNQNKDLKHQLTKAKELLNEFMRISKASDEDFEHDYSELIGETEQFLKYDDDLENCRGWHSKDNLRR